MENTRQIRGARTSMEQLEAYLCFLEEHLQFNVGKNTPENPNYLLEKWEELAGKLNGLKGLSKNAKDWKTSLTHWKYQVTSRARKVREEILLTGGGASSGAFLSAFEERALNLFGAVSVQGDTNISVLGFGTTQVPSNIERTISIPETCENLTIISLEADQHETSMPLMDVSNSLIEINRSGPSTSQSSGLRPTPNISSAPRKRTYSNSFSTCISEYVEKVVKLTAERDQHEKKRADDRDKYEKKCQNNVWP